MVRALRGRGLERAMWGKRNNCNTFNNKDLYFFKKERKRRDLRHGD